MILIYEIELNNSDNILYLSVAILTQTKPSFGSYLAGLIEGDGHI